MRRAAILLVLTILLAGCSGSPATPSPTPSTSPLPSPTPTPTPQIPAATDEMDPVVVINTTAGDIIAEIALEEVPTTAQNFLDLARAGYYDNITFHRVARNFVIQAGDATTRGGSPANFTIPDEFHPLLRHDVGVLSMATAGPDTGNTQFFITLNATHQLDDRHSVFGRVLSGMDVVRAIGSAPLVGNVTDGAPVSPTRIVHVSVHDAKPDAAHVQRKMSLTTPIPIVNGSAGRVASFALIVKNDGNARDVYQFASRAPDGWNVSFEGSGVFVPAKTSRVVLVGVTPPPDANASSLVQVRAVSANDSSASATLDLGVRIGEPGAAVAPGQNASVEYVGMLADGRMFDNDIENVTHDATLPTMSSLYTPKSTFAPFTFQVGSNRTIAGFSQLAEAGRVGETIVGRLPWQQAYAVGDMYRNPLYHRNLVFLVRIDAAS